MIVGFAFKVSAVPFHTWAPDTYEGAPTPVTAFLVGRVEGGRLRRAARSWSSSGSSGSSDVWAPMFWVLAALSMTVGNLVALRQTNMVRMLAYSSIAQGGFMLDAARGDRRQPGGRQERAHARSSPTSSSTR